MTVDSSTLPAVADQRPYVAKPVRPSRATLEVIRDHQLDLARLDDASDAPSAKAEAASHRRVAAEIQSVIALLPPETP